MRKDYFGILDYDKIKFFLCSKAKTERGIKFCGDLKPSYKIDCVKKNLSETSEAVSLITKKPDEQFIEYTFKCYEKKKEVPVTQSLE